MEVYIGMYHPEGGTSGEFLIKWIPLTEGRDPVPKFECFNDAWSALSLFKDLLDKMADIDGEEIQEPEFCKILNELGIEDITQYENPVTQIAICSYDKCSYPAEWIVGTWQCCDKHSKGVVTEKSDGEGLSMWGTAKRIGQKAILTHNVKFGLNQYIIQSEK